MGNYKYDWSLKSRIKICKECGKEYIPIHHYRKNYSFCSYACRNKSTGRLRSAIPKKPVYKICKQCKKEFEKRKLYSPLKFNSIKYCSLKCSQDATVGKINRVSNGSGYTCIQRGSYICSKGDHYFRSKWEANYALYLDFLVKQYEIEKWEFEPEVFIFGEIKSGTRSYRPDFKVFKYDGSVEYHEVKGYMDPRSKLKLKRMAKYYPEVKIILIREALYKDILKKLKGVIKFNN